ncbi:MAG: GNAT family N-acetyltransferase [Pirellulaceae bacterium]|nr:GNAT family N-acetyltransferase [Pirellulaceae bacterium]
MLFETKRLLLRRFRLEDAEDAFAMNQDPKVTRFIPGESNATVEAVQQLIQTTTLSDYEKYGYGRMAIIHKTDGHFMGFSGLKFLPDLQEVDLGYRLVQRDWGQGYATEAAQVVVRYGFETLGLQRIIAMAMRDNRGSIRVMQKLGMRFWKVSQYAGHEVVVYELTHTADTSQAGKGLTPGSP